MRAAQEIRPGRGRRSPPCARGGSRRSALGALVGVDLPASRGTVWERCARAGWPRWPPLAAPRCAHHTAEDGTPRTKAATLQDVRLPAEQHPVARARHGLAMGTSRLSPGRPRPPASGGVDLRERAPGRRAAGDFLAEAQRHAAGLADVEAVEDQGGGGGVPLQDIGLGDAVLAVIEAPAGQDHDLLDLELRPGDPGDLAVDLVVAGRHDQGGLGLEARLLQHEAAGGVAMDPVDLQAPHLGRDQLQALRAGVDDREAAFRVELMHESTPDPPHPDHHYVPRRKHRCSILGATARAAPRGRPFGVSREGQTASLLWHPPTGSPCPSSPSPSPCPRTSRRCAPQTSTRMVATSSSRSAAPKPRAAPMPSR